MKYLNKTHHIYIKETLHIVQGNLSDMSRKPIYVWETLPIYQGQ